MYTQEMIIVGILAVIVLLGWSIFELRQARKYGRRKHYITISNGDINEKVVAQSVDFLNPNKYPLSEEDTSMTERQKRATKIASGSTYGRNGL